jgi:mRNA interferase RelE/StbE
MSYRVEFTDAAKKELKKLDKRNAALILGWVRKNLEGCSDPRRHGKGLTANLGGRWRYRVGDYRLIAEIEDDRVIILILNVGHRKDVYDQSRLLSGAKRRERRKKATDP